MENKAVGLWGALARAQGKIVEPKFDKVNPHYKNSYASLASVWEACRLPLSTEGLSVVQGIESREGKFILVTKLTHESGEQERFECPIITDKNTMQGIGAAVTYARRYSLNALIGTSGDEDDDGNFAASKNDEPVKQQQKHNNNIANDYDAPPPDDSMPPNDDDFQDGAPSKPKTISINQNKRLWAIAHVCGWNEERVKKSLANVNIKASIEMPVSRYEEFIKYMESNKIGDNK